MAGCLAHRGPDDEGVWTDSSRGVVLAHRRLSIIDLTSGGHQPMVSASGRFVLVFNGEIYNYRDLRRDLESSGARLRTSSDTEVLLELIAAVGLPEALTRCRGMFALAVHDRAQGTLSLARDRMGEKPLYYGWSGTTFLFASECSALRAHPDFDDAIDRDALTSLLRYSFIPAPRSVYLRAAKLLPGTTLEVHVDRPHEELTPRPYWSLRAAAEAGTASPFEGTDEEAVEELDRVLQAAVAEATVSDVPVGAFLSGGIDSSLVVALMQARSAGPVHTYTIGFQDPAFDEAPFAQAVASHLGTSHVEQVVTAEQALAVVPELGSLYDEPFADASQLPTTLVCRLARQDVTVALSGDGGDELFGGYGRYPVAASRWRRVSAVPQPLRALAGPVLEQARRTRRLGLMVGAERPEDLYRILLTHWTDPERVVLGAREPLDALSDPRRPAALADPVARFMQLDGEQYLPDAVLAKVDRAAMSASLETRVPLLDPRVVELAWRLPARLRQGAPDEDGKVALRRVLDRYVPRPLVDRPKRGFAVPVAAWLRGPLRPWAEDLLAADRLRAQGLLDVDRVRGAWAEHLSGRRDTSQQLWNVLMLQSWLDRSPASRPEGGRPLLV
jgi:asparagine synthase (glutamine-hydrolysing)